MGDPPGSQGGASLVPIDDDGYVSDEGLTLASDDMDCADPGEATATEPGGDCDDEDATAFPGAMDVPDDGVDQDCDGLDATDGDSPILDDTGLTDGDKGCGCATGGDAGWLAALPGLLLALRRRRGATPRT